MKIQIMSLYAQCMVTLIRNVSWNKSRKRTIILEQKKEPKVLNKFVEKCPLSVTDEVLNTISNKNLQSCSLKQ